ncbi:MAG: Ldh family oxidoreductase [Candidatus Methylomirabilales bacterium]
MRRPPLFQPHVRRGRGWRQGLRNCRCGRAEGGALTEPRQVRAEALEAFARTVLRAAGVSPVHARTVAACLITANLEGVDTHGIARLPTYARRVVCRLVNPQPKSRVVRARGGAALMEGDNGLGPVVAMAAMNEAIRRARRYGVAWVSVRNSNHFSYAGYYCARAAQRGMIGLASSSGEPCVAPWGGRTPFFSNNPFALAAPTGSTPIVVDLATSVTSRGHILLAKQTGQVIPTGWAIDRAGRLTTNPNAALAGSVLPMAGAKGYALIVALEILSGVLTGGPFAPQVGSQYKDWDRPASIGQFFAAIDPSVFMPKRRFLKRMGRMIADVHRSTRQRGVREILLPGERRQQVASERRRRGIPLHPRIVEELKAVARELGAPVGGILQ